MTREELKAHCKRQIQEFERVEKIMPVTPNAWKRYEEHKLVLELLEQEPCEDAVSRQAVLDIVNNPLNIRLDEIIKKLPPVTLTQRWIPVSEKLPEKSTWVLVTCKNPDGYIYLDIKLINRYTGLWDGDEDFIGTVLAWMPLPEPYKAEREVKE